MEQWIRLRGRVEIPALPRQQQIRHEQRARGDVAGEALELVGMRMSSASSDTTSSIVSSAGRIRRARRR